LTVEVGKEASGLWTGRASGVGDVLGVLTSPVRNGRELVETSEGGVEMVARGRVVGGGSAGG
jgi:hypothetical protein